MATLPYGSRQQRFAFTLIEILVVVGVIAILLAVLLPSLSKARRSAQVLASPIAYVSQDGRVHLTNPTGGSDLSVAQVAKNQCQTCHSPPSWSPLGLTLGIPGNSKTGGLQSGLLRPSSGELRQPGPVDRQFIGWIDSTRFLEGAYGGGEYVVNADTGIAEALTNSHSVQVISIAPIAAQCQAPLIGVVFRYAAGGKPSSLEVDLIRSDLTPGKTIWGSSSITTMDDRQLPKVDAQGEWAAWTETKSKKPSVAMKSLTARSDRAPDLLGTEYAGAYFCDWTEQGELLCNVSRDGLTWRLVVLDTEGQLKRELSTSLNMGPGVVASYRKYMHR